MVIKKVAELTNDGVYYYFQSAGIRLQSTEFQVCPCPNLTWSNWVSFNVFFCISNSKFWCREERKHKKLCVMILWWFCSYGWYFTFVQGFVYLALITLQGFTTKQMVNPWKTYVKLSAVLMGSHGLTKGSLAYLNYPAQIMFKSTKV